MRQDIQTLRGLAIVLVVLFHAWPATVPAAYLGVDIFFVVSGYLLARKVQVELDAGRFRHGSFVRRRLRRLARPVLPVLVAVTAVGLWLLTASERVSLWEQLAGAATFTVNVVLWLQGGYFDQASTTKPLLHLWALAVIGQAALILPLLMRLPRGRWPWVAAVLAGASFAGLLKMIEYDDAAAYFLLPFRLWEFILGMLLTRLPPLRRAVGARRLLAGLAGLGMLMVAFAGDPGPSAWVMLTGCLLASAIIVLAPPATGMPSPLARLGHHSYALYLVHWPVLAFLHSAFLGAEPPIGLLLAALGVSFVGAWGLHRLTDDRQAVNPRVAPGTSAVLLAVLLWGAFPQDARAGVDWQHERRPNVGLHPQCDFKDLFQPIAQCLTTKRPRWLVWGDSMAMQWAQALADMDRSRPGVAQATMSTCGPLVGVSPVYSGDLGPQWARRCIAFNDSVLEWLRRQPALEHVLLGSVFLYHVERGQRLQTRDGTMRQSVDAAEEALMATVQAIRAAGKRVSIMAPVPTAAFDVGACLERMISGLPVLGRKDCDIDRRAWVRATSPVLELMRRMEASGVHVVHPDRVLCGGNVCVTRLDGVPLYRDKAHLSYSGAAVLIRKLELRGPP
ncbi:MAG TPA: acyltransferase family protein [Rubrivivax sp.]|nr:acyltransferase family protein [Rubrivivax sp.]